ARRRGVQGPVSPCGPQRRAARAHSRGRGDRPRLRCAETFAARRRSDRVSVRGAPGTDRGGARLARVNQGFWGTFSRGRLSLRIRTSGAGEGVAARERAVDTRGYRRRRPRDRRLALVAVAYGSTRSA